MPQGNETKNTKTHKANMEMFMNKVISTALFSARDAKEQRIRAKRSVDAISHPQGTGDIRRVETSWDRAAEGFRKQDPAGTKLAALVRAAKR
ncbi:MAG TPA: hypothetical protein VN578_02250 [Candidatus Binatia bacterium]|nr:hypothetical protein [Candidatus Binatia bacterium]